MFNIEVVTAFGLESVAASELQALGYQDITVKGGRIELSGTAFDVARLNLWLRTADRVLIRLGRFDAADFDQLYEGVNAIDWPSYLSLNAKMNVSGRSSNSKLTSIPAVQSVSKKALIESMTRRYKAERFSETGLTYAIDVALHYDRATITLDTTGPGLNRRGYRVAQVEAPLRETLAAAIVLLGRWNPERPFADPFCGCGTLPIEAALIGRNIAPGLRRGFVSEGYGFVGAKEFDSAREEAASLIRSPQMHIRCSDIDEKALEAAGANANAAGVQRYLRISRADALAFDFAGENGLLATNPPFGERLSDRESVFELYRNLGSAWLSRVSNWSLFILTATREFERLFGRRAQKRRKLYNARIECQLYQYFGSLPSAKGTETDGANL